jgi:L-seryl-tRNA(Ser) seleniumtransferase
MTDERRALPSVSALLGSDALQALRDVTPHARLVEAIRATLARHREDGTTPPADGSAWASQVQQMLQLDERRSLRPAINGTGVVLHTNLGRAPLAAPAIAAVTAVAQGYSTLEYDVDAGGRGSRYLHCASLLRELTGAEDALVVNNCAAALVLALNTVSLDREAVISRGELVEIGGSFRVHEIIERAGVRLRAVGATNRTHLGDYVRAISPDTGALLKVHRSNFALSGFVAEVDVPSLVPAAREHGLPIVHDLGSGLLLPLDDLGLRGEPTARTALRAGASIVMMSGDKLLGGPQAGIILGSAPRVAAMRANPLARAFRVDKMTLAALEATLALYRDPELARREIPVLAMLAEPAASIAARAEEYRRLLALRGVDTEVVESSATIGAGAFPTAELPSVALAFQGDAERWSAALRAGEPPVVGRIVDGRFRIDLRTVPAGSAWLLLDAVVTAVD